MGILRLHRGAHSDLLPDSCAPLRNFTGSTGSTELISSTAGKNKSAARQPSVADNVRPPQQNDLVRQAADGESAIDSLVKQQSAAVDSLMESFTEASSALDVSWISEKYGAGCDKLDALMSEFSAATFTNKMCGMLSPLEKLSLDFSLKESRQHTANARRQTREQSKT